MINIETIVNELESVPEDLLIEILDFIRTVKSQNVNQNIQLSETTTQRIPGLHQGEIWISDDFNDPLPDEFWLGDDE
ncbi:MAG: DUF2281 domain-containing protein [Sphaerospermopsis sp. SIO1G1]|nr:DUF2281 domain-containing protein [Sphaerospermopsis sp. SIO1G1]